VETIPSNSKIAEVLENCARAWRDGTIGWTQHVMARNDSGEKISIMHLGRMLNPAVAEVCGIGAIVWQTGDANGLFYAIKCEVEKRLARDAAEKRTFPFNLPSWNDDPSRTVEEVIDLFEETAKDLRNGAEV
jgi:hypothetical protein